MKVSTVSHIVSNLLRLHECVTIPGFGAFVVNPSGAQVDLAKNRFTPPGKQISFNKNITNNDGLLAHAIATYEGVSYQDALGMLKKFVAETEDELKRKLTFDFGEVGAFYRTREGLLKFEPNTAEHFFDFGMESFHLTPVADEVLVGREEVSGAVATEIKYVTKPSTWGRVGWAVAAIPLLAYLAWIPTQSGVLNNQKNFEFSDLNPFRSAPCEEYVPRPAGLTPLDLDASGLLYPDFDESKYAFSVPDTTNVVTPEVREIAEVDLRTLPYQIIGGCFRSKANAEKLVSSLTEKGYPAQILDKNKGLYRVSYGGFTTVAEARAALKEVKANTNASAWLLKSKL